MKTNFIQHAIVNRRTRKAVLQKAYIEVGHYRVPTFEKAVKNIPSFVGPLALFDANLLNPLIEQGNSFQQAFVGVLLASSYLFRNVALTAHKEAVGEAAKLGSKLAEKGFNTAERKIVINDKLSSGNFIFSNLFKLIYPKRVDKLADGIPTKSGFINI